MKTTVSNYICYGIYGILLFGICCILPYLLPAMLICMGIAISLLGLGVLIPFMIWLIKFCIWGFKYKYRNEDNEVPEFNLIKCWTNAWQWVILYPDVTVISGKVFLIFFSVIGIIVGVFKAAISLLILSIVIFILTISSLIKHC